MEVAAVGLTTTEEAIGVRPLHGALLPKVTSGTAAIRHTDNIPEAAAR